MAEFTENCSHVSTIENGSCSGWAVAKRKNNRREQGFSVLLPIHNLNFRVVTR
jgi:hypothetical protein